MEIVGYVCGGEKTKRERERERERGKKKKKGNIWMKERKRIRNEHLEILPQYFHNKF